ncbi:MAG: hypothetical protein OTJ44_01180 [Planctomycetota bacterium]|jgi:hypothetical protein|nr:hypothetical protein [Planctomycetota bacterium]
MTKSFLLLFCLALLPSCSGGSDGEDVQITPTDEGGRGHEGGVVMVDDSTDE